ncbi:MAG TPA: asparagine synthase (glutamine-hydrolyzing) [Terriglobales bacterium]|nr:asparagine synthase (glutamine-hydrolyzing) [Terriglobales bacterium]
MCGIAGFTRKKNLGGTERIRSAANSLVHRGPDQQGIFESGDIALAAARLKILDLQAGDQPIEHQGTVIVFNGEVYNHLEVRAELEQRGHRFRSHADTETVLHAFLEWDTACFARLRGMFAVALWTASEKRLVLARDRMGIKPLYFTRRGDDLIFGSELKAILLHPEVERRLSLDGLDCYLSLNYVPCPWTLVDGIEKLPPGHWLEWRDGAVRSEPYWTLPFDPAPQRTLESAKEELDALLKTAVREHLLSDVPLGVWLSGGMDSSTILHYAAAGAGSRLKTLSISFKGRSFDETPYMRAVASQYGTDHEEFDVNPDLNLTDTIEEFAYYSDEPSADAGALPVWFLSKLSRTKVTVALSGEGGDELFGGYLTYRADHLARRARRFPAAALGIASGLARLWPVSDEKISFEYKLKRFLEGCRMPPEQAHVFWNGTFFGDDKQQLLNAPLPGALNAILSELRPKLSAKDELAPYLWFDQKFYLPDDILTKADRMSMAHSLEVRPPLLDHRLVEFAATLPTELKVRGSRQRVIIKELMKDKLPASVLRRPKMGFDIPAHEWFRGPLRPLLCDTLEAGAQEHSGLFRSGAIDASVRAHLERRANLGYHLWGLLTLFLWMRRWKIQTSAPAPSGRPLAERIPTSI